MMKFSVLPFLFLFQVIAIVFAARHARGADRITRFGILWIYAVLFTLTVWGVISGILAANGAYQTTAFLRSWPAFWITLIPVVIIMLPLAISSELRSGLRGLIDHTPLYWLFGIHALRILAIGGIIKAGMGEFSPYFAKFVGFPDMVFGFSAALFAWLAFKGQVGSWTVVVWNLIGALIIVPPALILLQMGLPGPWQVFTEQPSIITIFEFPMALALTLVVPIFVSMNLLVAMRIFERLVETRRYGTTG